MQFSNLSKLPKCMIRTISSYLDHGRLIKMNSKWFDMGHFLEDNLSDSSDFLTDDDTREIMKPTMTERKSISNIKKDIAMMNRFGLPLEFNTTNVSKKSMYNHFLIAVKNPELSNGIRSLRFVNSTPRPSYIEELMTRTIITGFLDKMTQVSTIEFYYIYFQFQIDSNLIEVLKHGKKLETLKMCFEIGSIGKNMWEGYADYIFQRIPKLKRVEVCQMQLSKIDSFYPSKYDN